MHIDHEFKNMVRVSNETLSLAKGIGIKLSNRFHVDFLSVQLWYHMRVSTAIDY